MSTVQEEKQYPVSAATAYEAALGAVDGLAGKIKRQDAAANSLEVQYDKKILGKVLGDRTYMTVTISPSGEDSSTVAVEVYPLNAVGQKLLFGARKGVSATVVSWFYAHLEHRLPT